MKKTGSLLALPLVVFLFFVVPQLKAQEGCFEQVGNAHILCLAEDQQYIWAGTMNSGLLQYDKISESITYLNTSNSNIAANTIRSVIRYGGDIVFSTETAIYSYDGTTFTTLLDSLSGELGVNPFGHLIIAGNTDYYTWSAGNIVYHKNLLELVTFACDLCETTTDLKVAGNGDIWLSHYSFYEFDILQFDGTTWTLHDITTDSILPIESWSPHNRLLAWNGDIIATAIGQPYQLTNSAWSYTYENGYTIVTQQDDTLKRSITDLELDAEKGYWVGSYFDFNSMEAGKVAYYNTHEWFIFELPMDSTVTVVRMHASTIEPGTVYIGTDAGLLVLDKVCLDLPTGISTPSKPTTVLFPNPGNGLVHLSQPVIAEVDVTDLHGRTVARFEASRRDYLDVSFLPSGTYFLQLRTDTNTWVEKLIIR